MNIVEELRCNWTVCTFIMNLMTNVFMDVDCLCMRIYLYMDLCISTFVSCLKEQGGYDNLPKYF